MADRTITITIPADDAEWLDSLQLLYTAPPHAPVTIEDKILRNADDDVPF